jgi:hypothetical protein
VATARSRPPLSRRKPSPSLPWQGLLERRDHFEMAESSSQRSPYRRPMSSTLTPNGDARHPQM